MRKNIGAEILWDGAACFQKPYNRRDVRTEIFYSGAHYILGDKPGMINELPEQVTIQIPQSYGAVSLRKYWLSIERKSRRRDILRVGFEFPYQFTIDIP